MNMKRKYLHLITYIAVFFGLPSCENEIPYNPEMRQPCLVMNALLEAGEDKTNEVYLYLSTGDNLDKVNDDAKLTLYVNGQLAETPQAFKPEEIYLYPGEWLSPEDYETLLKNIHYKKYRLSTPLKPGDLVRLEATAQGSSLRATAEVQVPQPPQDFRVDTCTVPLNMGSGIVTPHRRYLVTINDAVNENNYYRLDIRNQFLVRYHIHEYLRDEQGNFIEDENHNLIYTERDSLSTQVYSDLVNREDIILTDGNVSHSQEDEDNLMFPRIENKYNIFTDNRFRNSSATLKVYTRLYDDFTANALHGITYGKTYCTQSIHIRLLNLTADYYRYLKALNCLDDDDYDTTLMEPVSLPCNVSGGIGFVGIATPREVVITFPERPCRNTSSSSL